MRPNTGWRSATLALALFISTGAGFGAEPFEGTWKLDPRKTKFTQGTAPRELTVVIERHADQLKFTNTGTDANGSPTLLVYTAPLRGGQLKFTSTQGPYNGGFQKRIDAYTREAIYTKDGTEVRSIHGVVGKDGRSLTLTVKGIDSQGNPLVGILVLNKQ
jgi:hypothetical protein